MTRKLIGVGLLAASVLVAPLVGKGRPPETTTIDCGESGTSVMGLNDADEVVGFTGDLLSAVGFVVDTGHIRRDDPPGKPASARRKPRCKPLAVPGAAATVPFGINDRGQIVGVYFAEGQTTLDGRGFLYRNGHWTLIERSWRMPERD